MLRQALMSLTTNVANDLKMPRVNGLEVLRAIKACLMATPHIGEVKLLLTDIVMPGMSGTEPASHLRVIKSELKLLFISGYTDDVGVETGDPASAYLQKPFTPEALASSVRELLDVKPTDLMSVSQQPRRSGNREASSHSEP